MKLFQKFLILPAILLACFVGTAKAASGNGIHDDGKFFSDGAIAQATKLIDQIDQKHQKDLLVETIPSVPDDQQAQLAQEGKEAFFHSMAITRARAAGVNGVYILICKDPSYLLVDAGKNTRQRAFTQDDVAALRTKLVAAFKQKQFDQGLLDGATFVQQQMNSHGTASNSGSGVVATPMPSPSANRFPTMPVPQANQSWGIGGIACVLIAVVFGIVALRGIFGRSRGGYYPPQGGGGGYYPQQGGGGYPQQGGGGYYPQEQGGSGFGRGLLGGLLGGAVGGYAADKWMHGGQQSGGFTPPSGNEGAAGGSFGGGSPGPDFGGGGDASAGGDFGGGGGGGDFSGGGGGGDSGGGGGSGGDF